MAITTILFLALAASMDCFAVALAVFLGKKHSPKIKIFQLAFAFGLFQALMTLSGYFLGAKAGVYIQRIDHWISFGLLIFLGIKMLREALNKKEDHYSKYLNIKQIFTLSVATSIDAFAIGISFALLKTSIVFPALAIGFTSLFITLFGGFLGKLSISQTSGKKAEILGGVVLILIGVKILLEHFEVFIFLST